MPKIQGSKFAAKFLRCFGSATTGSASEHDGLLAPKGRVHIRVGKDDNLACELEIEANYLKHPLLEKLLESSGEEFGFSYDGPLRIACDVDVFRYLLHLLNTSDASVHYMEGLSDLVSKFHSANARY